MNWRGINQCNLIRRAHNRHLNVICMEYGHIFSCSMERLSFFSSSALDPFQSSFRPGCSTETVLLALVRDLCLSINRGYASLLLLLDLYSVFDIVDYTILLRCLEEEIGMRGCPLNWFKYFLMDWTQSNSV